MPYLELIEALAFLVLALFVLLPVIASLWW